MLRLKYRGQKEILVLIMFWCPFLVPVLTQVLHIPSFIKYISDFAGLLLLLTLIVTKKKSQNEINIFVKWIVSFFIFTFFSYLINYQSMFYYLWGVRNNFRFFVYFFAIIFYFKERNIYECYRWLDLLFYINAITLLVQFAVLGYKQDLLGGIFGTESGCNGYLNLFFCVMLVKQLIYFQNKKIKLISFAISVLIMLVGAAMAELKFFYVEFVILLLVVFLVTKFSWRKLVIIMVAILAINVGYKVFMDVFPNVNLSISELINYASSDKGYTASGDLNRLGFLSKVNKTFLSSPTKQLIGMGLGNCDGADGYDIVTSPFLKKYSSIHYQWMSSTFLYLELGYFGYFFYIGFFVLNFAFAFRQLKNRNTNKMLFQISMLCSVVAALNFLYNTSLRVESGYMLYFLIAAPWALEKTCSEKLVSGDQL